MMNNYSENGMLPIMDGLICWLDARDLKEWDIIWKDRTGRYEFTIYGENLIENGYFIFDKNKKYFNCKSFEIESTNVSIELNIKGFYDFSNSYLFSIAGYNKGINISSNGSVPNRIEAHMRGNRRIVVDNNKISSEKCHCQ